MKELVFLNSINEDPFTTSDVIANATGNDYRSVQRIIEQYKRTLQEFGEVVSCQTLVETKGGMQNKIIYHLNIQQSFMLVSLLKNSSCSVRLKADFVSSLFNGRKPELKKVEKKRKSLYIIERNWSEVKVGISQSPKNRMRAIETQGGFHRTNSYITQDVRNPYALESACHKKLNHLRTKGEWFGISFEEAIGELLPIIDEHIEKQY